MMGDDELLAAIDAAEQAALGTLQGDVASDRADAIDRYLGKPYGDEIVGRSSVVSRDVSDVVEGVLANVLKPFVGGDQVVQFDPRGPDDEERARQETDYVNFVALERNNGFLVLNSAVKDALLLRAGYVKCSWYVRDDVVLEDYSGQSDDQLAAIMQDPDVEVISHTEYPDPSFMPQPQIMSAAMAMGQQMPQPMQPPLLHDFKVRRKRPTEYVRTDPTPPDEILVSQRVPGPSLQDADFVQHRTPLTLSEIRQMGFDVPDDIPSDDEVDTLEGYARQRFGLQSELWNDETQDAARRIVLFKDSWIRIDRDGDGVAELRRVQQVGKTILRDEETDIISVACFSAVAMPHQHLGLSVYDLIRDVAEIKTALMRQYMDNKYLANNARVAVDVDSVNLDDLLVSRPGGVVRVKNGVPPQQAIFPLVTPDTGQSALEGLEYLDTIREGRTGYTRLAQGLDSDSLVNRTATGYMQQTSQSQLRLEMIARTIAETGVRDLYRIIHALTLKHANQTEKVRLRSQWVDINPREWVKRTDLSLSVGLGSTSQSQLIGHVMMIAAAQEKAVMVGLVGPEQIYNTCRKLTNAAGFKNVDEFFKAPLPGAQLPQQQNPAVQVEMIKQEGAQKIKAAELQITQAREAAQRDADVQVQQHKIATDAELDKYKHELKLQYDLQQQQRELESAERIEHIKAAAQIEVARINASLGEGARMAEANAQAAGMQNTADATKALTDTVAALHQAITAPKERVIVRDQAGRAVAVHERPLNGGATTQ